MLYRFLLLVCFLLVFSFIAWCSGWGEALYASEIDLHDLIKRHNDQWGRVRSIQLTYTRDDMMDVVGSSVPDYYWESDVDKSRSIRVTLRDGVTMCEDFFCDGKDTFHLTIPQDKYPLTDTNMRLCDYASFGNSEMFSATLIPQGAVSIGTDIRLCFPLSRYLFVHTEDRWLTLQEVVNKYPSRIVAAQKNAAGDEVVEVAIESSMGNERFEPWALSVFINTSRGYHIDSYRLSTTAKMEPPIELIEEYVVKKYAEFKSGFWIPSVWERFAHNGDPTKASRVNFVVTDCRINDTLKSRLDDFRFPVNFPVRETAPGDQPEKVHIWGADNKPVRSFEDHVEYTEYYVNECMSGGVLPQENKFLVLRISLVILGLIMIAIALYKLYAKDR